MLFMQEMIELSKSQSSDGRLRSQFNPLAAEFVDFNLHSKLIDFK